MSELLLNMDQSPNLPLLLLSENLWENVQLDTSYQLPKIFGGNAADIEVTLNHSSL